MIRCRVWNPVSPISSTLYWSRFFTTACRLIILCVVSLLVLSDRVCGVDRKEFPRGSLPGVTAKAVLLIEWDSNRVIYALNSRKRLPIASVSKMMTALLAIEHLDYYGDLVLTPEEKKIFSNDRMTVSELMELLLISSNNRSAKIVARLVAGDEKSFVRMMNDRAKEMGLTGTFFVNASGLPNGGSTSTSTAKDLVLLTRAFLANPILSDIVSYRSHYYNGKDYSSTNTLMEKYYSATGVKTGYTKAAGRCIVLRWEWGGETYILIMLGSKDMKSSNSDAEIILEKFGLLPTRTEKEDLSNLLFRVEK